jgi:NAD(P)-dependent dehydrogenase (short-subunit alcohol dehydrogenase family)
MGGVPGLTGKVAMVWGGGSGMGEAAARRLAEEGCRLVIVDRDADAAARTAAALDQDGRGALAVTADVRVEADVRQATEAAVAAFGTVHLSASVVGVAGWKPLVEMSVEQWDHDQQLNLRPAFLIGREVARVMIEQGHGGALAFVSSISGMQGAALHGGYGAAKAAMNALVKTMAVEWGGRGIRVNAVAPGPIATARIKASPEMDALLARRIPLQRMGRLSEIAEVLAFLLSDMSSYMTGETLTVDGGWMAAPLIHPADAPAAPVAAQDRR